MTKKGIIIIAMLLAAVAARAFDFSATTTTGQTVYYSIVGSTTVKVVNPDWDSHTQPTGFMALPAAVQHDGTTYQVTAIDAQAFRGCSALTGVSVPEGVTSLGRMAFAFCTSLDSIVLPSTLLEIGSMAFTSTAYYGDNSNISPEGLMFIGPYVIAAHASIDTVVVVPEGTLGVGNMAFYSCEQMPQAVLPETLRFIGENAFNNCQSLDTLKVLNPVPPALGANAFLNVPAFTVVVPCGASDAYGEAEHWSELTIVEIMCPPTPPTPPDPPEPPTPPTPPAGIDEAQATSFSAVAVEGGLQIQLTDGETCTVRDIMGRVIAQLQSTGFVPLNHTGLYLVSSPLQGKTLKVIFNN